MSAIWALWYKLVKAAIVFNKGQFTSYLPDNASLFSIAHSARSPAAGQVFRPVVPSEIIFTDSLRVTEVSFVLD